MSSDHRRSSGVSGGSGSGSGRTHHRRHKSRRSRQNHSAVTLTAEDISFLKEHTRYDEQEIRDWHKGFKVG